MKLSWARCRRSVAGQEENLAVLDLPGLVEESYEGAGDGACIGWARERMLGTREVSSPDVILARRMPDSCSCKGTGKSWSITFGKLRPPGVSMLTCPLGGEQPEQDVVGPLALEPGVRGPVPLPLEADPFQ